MKHDFQKNQKQQTIRKAALYGVALIATAMLINTALPIIQPSHVFAQNSSSSDAEARAAARAAAKERAKRRAREKARATSRLMPRWDQPFTSETVRWLNSEYRVTARNVIGKTFREVITTRGTHTIRGDGKDCVSCHGSPALLPGAGRLVGISRQAFCDRVPGFFRVNQPEGNHGHKPSELKWLLTFWRNQRCGVNG